jgi:hypothetical protein
MRIIKTSIKDGKIIDNKTEIAKMVESLSDGNYVIEFEKIGEGMTPRKYQRVYFEKIDKCVDKSGYTRNEIHEIFKEFLNIETTKDIDEANWVLLHKKFTWWAYTNFDIIV